jgi:GT2 family glycosyltransferase
MSKPRVTVLIDTFNHERFIEEAITSALEQDFSHSEMEILVVDDGSTDRTPEIIRKFVPRVRHLPKTNGGQASAFNAGIAEAQGEFIAFLDGDDWWAKNKVSRVVDAMAAEPEVGIVGQGIVLVYPDGRQQAEILRTGHRLQANTLEGALLFRLRKSLLGTSRMTIRADVLRDIGPAPECLTIQADEYLFTLAAVLRPARILPEALTYYRVHEANAFQISGFVPERMKHKQRVLDSLARTLERQLRSLGPHESVRQAIVEGVQTEAIQLRLMLDSGFPWETIQTELKIERMFNAQSALLQRLFAYARILPAALMPPRLYYRLRRQIGQTRLYRSAREKYLPFPKPPHIEECR